MLLLFVQRRTSISRRQSNQLKVAETVLQNSVFTRGLRVRLFDETFN